MGVLNELNQLEPEKPNIELSSAPVNLGTRHACSLIRVARVGFFYGFVKH